MNKRLYKTYHNMKTRCLNPNNVGFKNYGGRGIRICDEWLDSYRNFEKWALNNGYSGDLTIERIDVNGNYEPSNCTWITKQEQARNKRNTHWVFYNGKKFALSDLAKKLKFDSTQFREYENRFGSAEKALDYVLKRKTPYGRCEKTVCYKGQEKPLREWCALFGRNIRTVEYRIEKYGWNAERALEEKEKPATKMIEYNGEVHSLKGWSEIIGVSYHTLRGRFYSGNWSIERMLTTPKYNKNDKELKVES